MCPSDLVSRMLVIDQVSFQVRGVEGVRRKEQQKPDHIHLFTHPFTNSFILSGFGQRGKWLSESQGLEELKGCN